MRYNELGMYFFESVRRKKYIIHDRFMLPDKRVWERDSHIDFCTFLGRWERETEAVGTLFQPPIACWCWRNSSFQLFCQWPFSDTQCLGKGCLYHGHFVQEPQNYPNPDHSCNVSCANGCNTNSFSVSLIICVYWVSRKCPWPHLWNECLYAGILFIYICVLLPLL